MVASVPERFPAGFPVCCLAWQPKVIEPTGLGDTTTAIEGVRGVPQMLLDVNVAHRAHHD